MPMPHAHHQAGSPKTTTDEPVVQISNLRKSFTIIGPSGCGKTTLLHIIGGFSPPDRGNVLVDGRPSGNSEGGNDEEHC